MLASTVLLLLLSIAVGAVVPVQSGSNATLARHIGHPLYAAFTNTFVATLVLLVAVLVMRLPAPTLRTAVAGAPWWAWMGGLYGATLVFSALTLAPRVGATAFVSATIFGTMAMSLVVDHFGLLAFRQQAVTGTRLVGAVLVVVGMILIARR